MGVEHTDFQLGVLEGWKRARASYQTSGSVLPYPPGYEGWFKGGGGPVKATSLPEKPVIDAAIGEPSTLESAHEKGKDDVGDSKPESIDVLC